MISKYYLSSAAEQDIDEIITYLAQENPRAAHIFLNSLYDAMENLSIVRVLSGYRDMIQLIG